MADKEKPDSARSARSEPISVRIPDAVRMTGLSRTKIYQLITSGEIEVAKIGRSTVVIFSSLQAMIASRRRQ